MQYLKTAEEISAKLGLDSPPIALAFVRSCPNDIPVRYLLASCGEQGFLRTSRTSLQLPELGYPLDSGDPKIGVST